MLLDDLERLSHEMINGTTHIAAGFIMPPWEELAQLDEKIINYIDGLENSNVVREHMKHVPWEQYKSFASRAEHFLKNVSSQNSGLHSSNQINSIVTILIPIY